MEEGEKGKQGRKSYSKLCLCTFHLFIFFFSFSFCYLITQHDKSNTHGKYNCQTNKNKNSSHRNATSQKVILGIFWFFWGNLRTVCYLYWLTSVII